MEGRICPCCGTPLNENAKFCVNCGKPIERTEPAAPACATCGEPLKPGAAFCVNCGAAVDAKPDMPVAPTEATEPDATTVLPPAIKPAPATPLAEVSDEQPAGPEKEVGHSESPKGRSKTKIIVAAIIAVVLLLGAGLGAWLYMRSSHDKALAACQSSATALKTEATKAKKTVESTADAKNVTADQADQKLVDAYSKAEAAVPTDIDAPACDASMSTDALKSASGKAGSKAKELKADTESLEKAAKALTEAAKTAEAAKDAADAKKMEPSANEKATTQDKNPDASGPCRSYAGTYANASGDTVEIDAQCRTTHAGEQRHPDKKGVTINADGSLGWFPTLSDDCDSDSDNYDFASCSGPGAVLYPAGVKGRIYDRQNNIVIEPTTSVPRFVYVMAVPTLEEEYYRQ